MEDVNPEVFEFEYRTKSALMASFGILGLSYIRFQNKNSNGFHKRPSTIGILSVKVLIEEFEPVMFETEEFGYPENSVPLALFGTLGLSGFPLKILKQQY